MDPARVWMAPASGIEPSRVGGAEIQGAHERWRGPFGSTRMPGKQLVKAFDECLAEGAQTH